jgi:hypothetical protein
MGWPKASMIRPSQAVVGRTLAAWSMMRISAPGATPSTGPKGISRALESRNPTTSAGRAVWPRRPISARAPTARRDRPPRDSISRPETPATLPVTTSGSIASTAATRLRKIDPRNRR